MALKLLHFQRFPPMHPEADDWFPISDKYGHPICNFAVTAACQITGVIAWEDEDGRAFISIVDGFRASPYDDGPYYPLSVRWKHEFVSFPTISVEEWASETDVFLYPMRDEAWGTP